MVFDNSDTTPVLVLQQIKNDLPEILDIQRFKQIKNGKE